MIVQASSYQVEVDKSFIKCSDFKPFKQYLAYVSFIYREKFFVSLWSFVSGDKIQQWTFGGF